ncbi:hypothetical protein [Halorussus halobius]|uniref:hypothetical protein n=1 Tax=Halorussus halobius TaxID=1710537 RepID=UPI00109272E1|nr:hypothetical protein [Halorussus halobius]
MDSDTVDSDTTAFGRREKGALLVGFAAFAGAVLVAHGSPPDGYELSIYAGTPTTFWAGVGVALLVAVGVGLGGTGAARRLALVLGGAATLSVAGLPVFRSYYFFGAGDSLTHLGWVKDLTAGELSVLEFLYPGTHTVAAFLADVTGMAPNRALLVTVVAFVGVFLTFLPLATWTVTRDRLATALAALSGLLLLPVNTLSVFNMAHPTSQAIMFAPLVVYLTARYLVRADRDTLPVGTPTGALLAVAAVAIVLVHPQQAGNALVVFVAILGVQFFARWTDGWSVERLSDAVPAADRLPGSIPAVGRLRDALPSLRESVSFPAVGHRTFAVPTVVLAGAFLAWTPRHEQAAGASAALVGMLLEGPEVGADVAQRSGSLAAVGGSVELLFVKLLLVSLVFCALAGLLVAASALGRVDDAPDASAFARYLGLALVPLVGLMVAYFVVSYEQLHFRQLGFVMVLATMLGAIALARGTDRLAARFSPGLARTVVGAAVVVMLALSIPALFQSPYMYQSSSHVTAAQVDGYESALDHQGSAPMIGVRGSGERWTDAILGYEESRGRSPTTGSLYESESYPAVGENFTGAYVADHYDESYLTFTDRLRRQEVEVYEGLRFDRAGFESFDATPGLNRVHATGGAQTYHVNGTS